MSHASVRRRARDGLVEIVPESGLTRADRYLALFGVILASMVLYVSTLLPAWAFAVLFGYCVAAALAVLLQQVGLLQPPKAPVHVLSRWRGPGPGRIA
ncbi:MULTISPECIES: hypothetical protein [unclassified Anaeromyxobacter]|uniref:hypothetical protein n=1 Tax=unclassified Anaeromyxobacter TaxID=2620896 RepID=UPI001F56DD50|nr:MULTISPECIES: hypothetical protein [unclassified Anaeromyxobacter]